MNPLWISKIISLVWKFNGVFVWIYNFVFSDVNWYFRGHDNNKFRRKLSLVVIILLLLYIFFRKPSIKNNEINFESGKPVTVTVEVFKDKIKYIPVNSDGRPIIVSRPAEGRVTINPDGSIKIQKYGVCFLPALGVAYSDFLFKPTLDARLLFWCKLGLGVGITDFKQPIGAVFLDYRLPYISNVAVFGGINSRNVTGGVHVFLK
jgi:hypothetical protein